MSSYVSLEQGEPVDRHAHLKQQQLEWQQWSRECVHQVQCATFKQILAIILVLYIATTLFVLFS